MMHGSLDIKHNRYDFLSFCAFLCPFTPLTTKKNKLWLYDVWFLRDGALQMDGQTEGWTNGKCDI